MLEVHDGPDGPIHVRPWHADVEEQDVRSRAYGDQAGLGLGDLLRHAEWEARKERMREKLKALRATAAERAAEG